MWGEHTDTGRAPLRAGSAKHGESGGSSQAGPKTESPWTRLSSPLSLGLPICEWECPYLGPTHL